MAKNTKKNKDLDIVSPLIMITVTLVTMAAVFMASITLASVVAASSNIGALGASCGADGLCDGFVPFAEGIGSLITAAQSLTYWLAVIAYAIIAVSYFFLKKNSTATYGLLIAATVVLSAVFATIFAESIVTQVISIANN